MSIKTETQYLVQINTGREWRTLTGWDDYHPTLADAEACAARARENDGWSARVVVVDE